MDIKSHQFLSYFEPVQANLLSEIAIIENMPDQSIIFEEGEIPDFLYLVLKGKVEFKKHTVSSKYQTVAVAVANDFFGEFGVLDGQPRSARAVTCGETTLAKITRPQLMEILLATNGGVVLQIFRSIIQRLRETTDHYVEQIVYQEKKILVGEMVNTIIHDFKSPFTGIQLASSVLKEMHPDEDTQEWCELIQAQIARMLSMADELLDFARGNPGLNKTQVNFIDLLQRFEKLNHVYLQASHVAFSFTAPEINILADEAKILRVLQNLVSNAVEAFNGNQGHIEINVSRISDYLEIKISDNGSGIPEEIKERLFDAFVTYGKRGGTGLGTAIAKSIVEAHGGTISFQSQIGTGTTFYIHLPLMCA